MHVSPFVPFSTRLLVLLPCCRCFLTTMVVSWNPCPSRFLLVPSDVSRFHRSLIVWNKILSGRPCRKLDHFPRRFLHGFDRSPKGYLLVSWSQYLSLPFVDSVQSSSLILHCMSRPSPFECCCHMNQMVLPQEYNSTKVVFAADSTEPYFFSFRCVRKVDVKINQRLEIRSKGAWSKMLYSGSGSGSSGSGRAKW